MTTAMRKRFWAVSSDHPEAPDHLREEYAQWEETQYAAYEQVKRFYALTGGYPIVGDELHITSRKPSTFWPGLRITRRMLFSTFESEEAQLIYEVEPEDFVMEELEEYQAGDLVEDED